MTLFTSSLFARSLFDRSLFDRSTLAQAVLLASTAAALALPSAALADALVVRSTGPSAVTYPIGRRLPPTERIVLRAGDRVVLVGEGATRTLAGPGNFPVRATTRTTQSRRSTLNNYLSASGGSISRTGAVRGGTSAEVSAPNLWLVDVRRGGNFCVADAANLTLWRPDMSEDTLLTVQVEGQAGGQARVRASVSFVAGQNFRGWPSATVPVTTGQAYRISGPGLDQPTQITLIPLTLPPATGTAADAESVANALADHGCTAQLAQLGDQLAQSSGR
jgi:hypothetical protein